MFDPTNSLTPTPNHHHHQGYGNFYLDQEDTVQFRSILTDEDEDSGICSPPLWKTTATTPSPNRSPSHPLLGPNNSYKSLSPNSRAQAIARGQMELMEMVKNMPESSYELSLKDIVEHRAIEGQLRGNLQQRVVRRSSLESDEVMSRSNNQKKTKKKKSIGRNGSFDIETRGFFLNMFFPLPLKTKKNKEKENNNHNNSKSVGSNNNSGANGEKDWWKKKKFTASSDSESSKVSSNSGSSGSTASSASTGGSGSGRSYGGRRKKGGLLRGCWPFFESRSRKSV